MKKEDQKENRGGAWCDSAHRKKKKNKENKRKKEKQKKKKKKDKTIKKERKFVFSIF